MVSNISLNSLKDHPVKIVNIFLYELDKMIDYLSVSCDNHVIIGGFILQPSTSLLKKLMNSVLYNLIRWTRFLKAKELSLIWFLLIEIIPLKTLIL